MQTEGIGNLAMDYLNHGDKTACNIVLCVSEADKLQFSYLQIII